MRVHVQLSPDGALVAVRASERRDGTVYAIERTPKPLADMTHEELKTFLTSLQDRAAERYAKTHMPRGYTATREV